MKLLNLFTLLLLAFFAHGQQLDLSFHQDGRNKAINYSQISNLRMAISPDQHLIIAGVENDTSSVFYKHIKVMKFKVDGTIDSTFGSFGNQNILLDTSYYGVVGNIVLTVQSDNKIVLSTIESQTSSYPSVKKHSWARLHPNGNLDTSFANQGTAGVIIPSYLSYNLQHSIALPNDDILILFRNCTSGSYILKLKSNGSIDSSFGNLGYSAGCYSDLQTPWDIAVQNDGKILIGGFQKNNALARFNANGTIDSMFGINGITITQIDTFNQTLYVMPQSDGSIYTAGYYTDTLVYPYACSGDKSGGFIHRFLKDGSLDTSFNQTGTVRYQHPLLSPHNVVQFLGVHVLNNKLVATGCYQTGYGQLNYFLVGYHLDGKIDSTFGINGTYITYESDSVNWCTQSFIHDSDKILLFGNSRHSINANASGYLARYTFNMPSYLKDYQVASELNFEIFPNPANRNLTISFSLEAPQPVSINLLDLNGKVIKTLYTNTLENRGQHKHTLELNEVLSEQLYLIQLQTKSKNITKALLVK